MSSDGKSSGMSEGGGEGAETGVGAGEGGCEDDRRPRCSGRRSRRDVTRSNRSIRASSSAAGLWVVAAGSTSLPAGEINHTYKHYFSRCGYTTTCAKDSVVGLFGISELQRRQINTRYTASTARAYLKFRCPCDTAPYQLILGFHF